MFLRLVIGPMALDYGPTLESPSFPVLEDS